MSEMKRSMITAGVAVALALLAIISTPGNPQPDAFTDKGEAFFPSFEDPNEATSMEVIDYNEETGEAIPFKVEFKNGKWTIPSHHDYPADGKDRLAKTAAGVIGITKDDFRTDNPADYAACGVIDPLDVTETSLEGRGKRVTLRDANGSVLADFIIGKEIEGTENYRFVRVPEQKRVYAVNMDIDISTTFSDWIESDLLKVEKDDINRVVIKDYSINERTRAVDQRDEVVLTKAGSDWQADRMQSNQEIDKTKMNSLVTALDDLNIVGVRPKPEGLSASLKRMDSEGVSVTQSDMMSLQNKGFYFASDGQLLSNEGEITCKTSKGVEYTLRFGEIVYGTGETVSAGGEGADQSQSGPGENRYLFISTSFDASLFTEPKKPANMEFQSKADSLWSNDDHDNKELHDAYSEWEKKVQAGQSTSEELNARFSDWYYVISQDSYQKLKLNRGDLVKKKEEDKA